jgi:hypothetical protein
MMITGAAGGSLPLSFCVQHPETDDTERLGGTAQFSPFKTGTVDWGSAHP